MKNMYIISFEIINTYFADIYHILSNIHSPGILKTWNHNFFKLVNFSNIPDWDREMSDKKFPIKITQKVLAISTDLNLGTN